MRETAADVARTLACYHAVICARVIDHATLSRMVAALDAGGVGVPVVNLLSDRAHPVQALADLLTLRQLFGPTWRDRTLAFVGDANNVWRSLALACALAGMATRLATPVGYGPAPEDVDQVRSAGGRLEVTEDPHEAAAGADVLYTDVWTSMGQEDEAERRHRDFARYAIDEDLVALARSGGRRPALPARPPRPRDQRRCDRRPAQPGLATGGEPNARHAGRAGLGRPGTGRRRRATTDGSTR